MKILVSDYDDTLYVSPYKIKLNVKAIKKFRDNENIFVISTARDFKSIKEEIKRFNIPYDFVNCYNGNALFNNNDELLDANYFDSSNIKFLKALMESNSLFRSINFFDENGYIDKDKIKEKLDKIIALKLIPKDIFNLKNNIEYLKENLKDISIESSLIAINVTPKNNKGNGIDIIKYLIGAKDNDIYTIGDNINDLEMIKKYNGYNMLFSHPKLYTVSKGTCSSVKSLIKKINKGTNN